MASSRPAAARRLHPIERIDLAVADATALDGRTRLARRIGKFAELGDQPPMRALCGLAIAGGLVTGERMLVRAGLRMLAAHSVATAAKSLVKHRVDRTRPGDAMNNGRYRLDPGHSHAKRLSSMPSGHSAGVVAVARAIGRDFPGAGPAVTVAAGAVMAAQMPSKNHFLSDLVVGAAIGLVSEAAVSALMNAAGGRG